jgi:hypothetical protein
VVVVVVVLHASRKKKLPCHACSLVKISKVLCTKQATSSCTVAVSNRDYVVLTVSQSLC